MKRKMNNQKNDHEDHRMDNRMGGKMEDQMDDRMENEMDDKMESQMDGEMTKRKDGKMESQKNGTISGLALLLIVVGGSFATNFKPLDATLQTDHLTHAQLSATHAHAVHASHHAILESDGAEPHGTALHQSNHITPAHVEFESLAHSVHATHV